MMTTSVRIDKTLADRLQKLAELTGRTKTWYIRQALESFLSQEEWLVQAIEAGVKAADEGDFASEEKVREVFTRWGVDVEG